MKKLLLGTVAMTALTAAGAANAADLRTAPPPAPAVPVFVTNDILNANNQVSLDFAATDFNYREFLAGTGTGTAISGGTIGAGGLLDTEKGWVPGVSVSASVMADFLGIHDVYVSHQSTFLSGHTAYWSAPLTNTDGATVWDEDFRLGKGFDVSTNVMLTPYLGAGTHLWGRNLPGAGGYHEDYSHDYAGGGLMVQVAPVSRLVLSANGFVGSTFNAAMNSTRIGGGFAAEVPDTFKLGSKAIYMAGISADYAITDRIHANVGVDYVTFKYGQSPVSLAGYLEPNSTTSNVTVKAGLGYSFAADLAHAPSAAAMPASTFAWSGLYSGANIGGIWTTSNAAQYCINPAGVLNGAGCTLDGAINSSASGLMGGAQTGYNWQFNSIVAGLEADLDAAPVTGSASQAVPAIAPNSVLVNEVSSRLRYFGTARARLGILATDSTLVYATGGLAFGGGTVGSTLGAPTLAFGSSTAYYPASTSFSRAGWTFGGGVEHAFTPNWTVKLEGLYFDLGTVTTAGLNVPTPDGYTLGYHFRETGGLIRIGLNYKFGAPPPPVVAARY